MIEWAPLEDHHVSACDRLAGETFESGFMQSSFWARFKESEGYKLHRLGLFDRGDLVGFTNGFTFSESSSNEFLICPEGPVMDWGDQEFARLALRKLTEYIHSHVEGVVGVRIQPEVDSPAPGYLRNWKSAPVDLTPDHTLYVDLTADERGLLAQMKPKGRYNLGLAQRHGVEVSSSQNLSDVMRFYGLFQETANRNRFFSEPLGFFLNLGSALFPHDNAEVLFACYRGELLASILVLYFGRRATYLYGGSSSSHRNVMPNYLLHWEAILRAKKRGSIEYDLYGYDPFGRSDHLYAGITRFKTQWGGRRQSRIGARDYIFYDRLADAIVEQLAASSSQAISSCCLSKALG